MTDSGEVDEGELVNIGTINVPTSNHILDCFLLGPNDKKPKHVCIIYIFIYILFLYSFLLYKMLQSFVFLFYLSNQSVQTKGNIGKVYFIL